MTTRLRVAHRSHYRYAHSVLASYNEARLTPMATAWQVPMESHLRVPQASWQYRYLDYWATLVSVFEAHTPHTELLVEATSLVEVDDRQRPAGDVDTSWDTLLGTQVYQSHAEYLMQTALTEPAAELADLARDAAAGRRPYDAVHEICGRIHDAMTYQPGFTSARSPAGEAWAARTGVCQDYAHLLIGALRHLNIPARYASGYLHPRPETDLGDTVTGDSHAWVEWWAGEWVGLDPANVVAPGEWHVLVGRGRDYADVPPIKGIVAGTSAAADLDVTVEMTRLA